MASHDLTKWHPHDGDHHHGVDPKTYLPIFGETLETYLAEYGEVGFPWRTSETEEHEGYIWLYTRLQLGEAEDGKNQICDALIQLHTTGEGTHFLKRFHSHYGFFRVVSPDATTEGIVATGGWADYGNAHLKYKQSLFPLPTDPPGLPLGQPPYRAQTTEFRNGILFQFWSGHLPNPIAAGAFDVQPQWLFGLGWSTIDSKEYFGPGGESDLREAFGPAGNTKFQIWNLQLHNLPTERPFAGWTDRWGYLTKIPGPAGVDKVPLAITAGVPQGAAALARRVQQGNPAFAPILDFGPGTVPPPSPPPPDPEPEPEPDPRPTPRPTRPPRKNTPRKRDGTTR